MHVCFDETSERFNFFLPYICTYLLFFFIIAALFDTDAHYFIDTFITDSLLISVAMEKSSRIIIMNI